MQISLTQEVRRVNKNSLFGGRGGGLKRKCYLKIRKCHAYAQRGVEYFCDRKQSGASVNDTVNCAVEKLYESRRKMKNRQMGILTALRRRESKFKRKAKRYEFFFVMCVPLCYSLHPQTGVFLLTFTSIQRYLWGFKCTAAQVMFANISDGAPSSGLGTRKGPLPQKRWSHGLH